MPRKLSIAVIAACPFPYPRGTPVRIHRSSEALARAGADVEVVTYHLGQTDVDTPFRVSRIRPIATYRRVDPGPSCQKLLLVDPLLVGLFRRVLAEHRFDVIHAHHYEGLLVALASRPQQPIIYDAHTMLESEIDYYSPRLLRGTSRIIGRQIDRWLPRKADHIIAVTDKIKQRLIAGGSARADDITVIPNGVDMEPFLGVEHADWGDGATIVFAGNMASYQGIELLLQALKQVLDVRPEARLLVVSNSSFAPYENLAAALAIRDRIDIVDADFAELPRLLAQSDVAVSPRSECDGLPQKLLNYMAAGLPTVSFEGSAATLKHDVTGLLVENDNIAAFAQSICRLLSDRVSARRLGQEARAVARVEYSWDAGAEKALALYDGILLRNKMYRRL